MNNEETIVAICSGVGGAVSILRISGKEALIIGNKVWSSSTTLRMETKRQLLLGRIVGQKDRFTDKAMAVYMPAPKSYTGEDVVEIHCHGGALCTKQVLDITLSAGAKPAEPGEFTYRAFINGKMDLTQAEAVSDIISAHSEMALHLAERQMSGSLKNQINVIRENLIDILSECESRMDFAEEDLDWTQAKTFCDRINANTASITKLADTKTEGGILRNGIRAVIAGKPNVGKSSLLNTLLGYDRAIVTKLPGTTRDTLEEMTHIRGIPVKITDTAGIREVDDLIEGMGVERSKETMKQAQIIFWLLDASAADLDDEIKEMSLHIKEDTNVITVWNKADCASSKSLPNTGFTTSLISIKENTGMDNLMDNFEKAVWGFPHTEEPEVAVSSRHALLLNEALETLPFAAENILSEDWELASIHLRVAILALGSITGDDADPDILDNIFSKFCIGK